MSQASEAGGAKLDTQIPDQSSDVLGPHSDVLVDSDFSPVNTLSNPGGGCKSMGAHAPLAPPSEESFSRVIEHYFSPGAFAFHVRKFTAHCSLLPMEQYREAFPEMCDSKFFPIARGLIEQLGQEGEEAESVIRAVSRLGGLVNSKIVRGVFNREYHGGQPRRKRRFDPTG